jgi:hypothetical protein
MAGNAGANIGQQGFRRTAFEPVYGLRIRFCKAVPLGLPEAKKPEKIPAYARIP